jgi:hypothetical protein
MADAVFVGTLVCILFMVGFVVGVLIVVGLLGHWKARKGPGSDGH